MGHLLGYARVSTPDQELALQHDALDAAGCYKTFSDVASGAKTARPDLDNLLDQIRPGDTLVVWKLDRLGRSMQHLIDTVGMLRERGVHFRSLTEGIDTATPTGKLVFHIFAALAEFERDRIIERTQAGLAAARARGRHGGRRKSLTPRQVLTLYRMYDSREHTVAEVAETLGTSRATVYRELANRESRMPSPAGSVRA
jgi:DNA invertase Pin-like site-specific DNA recombinase